MNVKQLMDYGKKFIIIGSMNATHYRDIFGYIKNDKMWWGNNSIKEFRSPDGEIKKFGNILWYTNISHKKHNTPIDLYKRYSNEYKHYENYDAIEVSKVCDIPMDYNGIMGVPDTFLDKYCPEQFEILGKSGLIDYAENECEFFVRPSEENAKKYKSQDKTWRAQNTYIVENGVAKTTYSRIFIRKRTA